MAFVTFRCRIAGSVAGALAALVMTASPANAALPDNDCPAAATSQPFAPWMDFANYVPAPGGNMEHGGPRWALTGDARIVDGNEPFYVGSWKDRASLRLPAASSAATTPMCITAEYPTLRFFAKRDGGSLRSSLLIEALFTDPAGQPQAVPLAVVENAGAWAPTAPLATVISVLGSVDPINVSFRFTPQDDSQWSIDDVYVDPYRTI